MNSLKRILLKIADKIGITSKIPRQRIHGFIKRHATDARTLDIGSAGGPYAKYYPNRVSVDIDDKSGPDYVLDAHDLSKFKDGEFDAVLCTEVLEHMHTPQKAVDEMFRVLAKNGEVILTTRFVFPLHNVPRDFYRYTEYGLRHLFRDFGVVNIEEEIDTMGTLAVLLERIAFQTRTFGFSPLSFIWLILSKILRLFSFVFTKQFGDVGHTSEVKNIMTSGYYVHAKK